MESREEIIKRLKSKKIIIDGHSHVGISLQSYLTYGYPYCLSFEDRVVRMKHFGIDCSVVFPFVDSAYYEKDLQQPDIVKTTNKYCQFPYELENKNMLNEIYEIFPQYSHKAIPVVIFDPSREAEQQAELFEELYQKYPIFGLKTAPTYIQAYVMDLETKGKAILDFAERHALPIFFHSAYRKQDPWASVYDIIRFAKNHPEIRISVAHSARFVKEILDQANDLANCFVDLSAFIIHCQLAVQNSPAIPDKSQRFDANYHDPLNVLIKLINAYQQTIIWGTDTPFYYWIQKYYDTEGNLIDTTLKCDYDEEINLLKHLKNEFIYKIAYENTIRFLFGDKTDGK